MPVVLETKSTSARSFHLQLSLLHATDAAALSSKKHWADSLAQHLLAGKITKQKWKRIRSAELRAGVNPDDAPHFEEALRRLRHGEWVPRGPHILQVGLIPELQEAFLGLLTNRYWELMRTDSTRMEVLFVRIVP